MSPSEPEIAVDDPTAPAADSPPVAATRTVEAIVYVLLLALAALLAFDNMRTGAGWRRTVRRPVTSRSISRSFLRWRASTASA
jgi:putative tricarboxylic transport membrane protein